MLLISLLGLNFKMRDSKTIYTKNKKVNTLVLVQAKEADLINKIKEQKIFNSNSTTEVNSRNILKNHQIHGKIPKTSSRNLRDKKNLSTKKLNMIKIVITVSNSHSAILSRIHTYLLIKVT
jgi:hypothetical protein